MTLEEVIRDEVEAFTIIETALVVDQMIENIATRIRREFCVTFHKFMCAECGGYSSGQLLNCGCESPEWTTCERCGMDKPEDK